VLDAKRVGKSAMERFVEKEKIQDNISKFAFYQIELM
jgi:hypothetical protein